MDWWQWWRKKRIEQQRGPPRASTPDWRRWDGGGGTSLPDLVEDGFGDRGKGRLAARLQVKDDDLVGARAEPAPRAVECLLGTDTPKPAEIVPVDPYRAERP